MGEGVIYVAVSIIFAPDCRSDIFPVRTERIRLTLFQNGARDMKMRARGPNCCAKLL